MTLNTHMNYSNRKGCTCRIFAIQSRTISVLKLTIIFRDHIERLRAGRGVLPRDFEPSSLSWGPSRGTKQRADNPTQWRRRRLPDHPGALLASRCVFYLGTSRSRPPGRAFGGRTPQPRSAAPVEFADTIAPPRCGLLLGRWWCCRWCFVVFVVIVNYY